MVDFSPHRVIGLNRLIAITYLGLAGFTYIFELTLLLAVVGFNYMGGLRNRAGAVTVPSAQWARFEPNDVARAETLM
jgi:hypothetical protein